jgi:hypothetical protein
MDCYFFQFFASLVYFSSRFYCLAERERGIETAKELFCIDSDVLFLPSAFNSYGFHVQFVGEEPSSYCANPCEIFTDG